MKLEFSRQISEKYSNVKFHENPSGGSRVVPCGRRGVVRRTDMTRLIVAIRNFANAPKNPNKVDNRKYYLLSLSEVEIR